MFSSAGSGFLIILIAGVVQGSVLTPMAYLKKWSWENTWLIYSIFAYLLLPWPFALLTVPKLFSAFAAVPHQTILWTLVLGFVWGLAVVLYGLGVDMLGLALGTAIILGMGTSVGSIVPLIGQHREKLWASSGITTLSGIFLLTIAVALFAVAGQQRDRILQARSGRSAVDMGLVRSGRFLAGLIICILCGLLSPLLNITFAYSTEIQKQAINHGANPIFAANAIWLLLANAGFLPSFFYSLYLLRKNRTWSAFGSGAGRYWLLPAADGPDVDILHRPVRCRSQSDGFPGPRHWLAGSCVHFGSRRELLGILHRRMERDSWPARPPPDRGACGVGCGDVRLRRGEQVLMLVDFS
jgi:L-rhamnose-H+ transport protein